MHRWLRVLLIASLGIWLGANIWFSFIQSPLLFREAREVFPTLQNLLFPRFWHLGYICLGTAAVLSLLEGLIWMNRSFFVKSLFLCLLLGMVASVQGVITPRFDDLTAAMRDKPEAETTVLRKVRNAWHGTAMVLNLIWAGGTALLLITESLNKPMTRRDRWDV